MSKSHSLAFRSVIVFALVFSAFCLRAEIVTFYFAGQVSSIYNPYGVVSPSLISVGNPVQASLQFDTSTPDWPLYVDDPTRGSFVGPGWLKVNINGLNFEKTTEVQVDILHGANGGQELFQAMAFGDPTAWPAALPASPNPTIFLAFWETQPPYDLLSSAELPVTMDFSRADMIQAFARTSLYEIRFDLLQQVPEPSVTALMAGGLILLSQRRIRF